MRSKDLYNKENAGEETAGWKAIVCSVKADRRDGSSNC